MNFEDWIKLLTYEVAVKNGYSLKNTIRKINELQNLTELYDKYEPIENTVEYVAHVFDEEKKKKEEKEEFEEQRYAENVRKYKEFCLENLLDPEPKEEKNVSISFRLGEYIGEYIARYYLPVLSVGHRFTPNVIYVSDEEQKIADDLNKKYLDGINDWNEYRAYVKTLEDKYLNPKLSCVVPYFKSNDVNEEELILGLEDALFNCDFSHYDTKDIEITHRYHHSTIILNKN